jgi:hypothetical protein
VPGVLVGGDALFDEVAQILGCGDRSGFERDGGGHPFLLDEPESVTGTIRDFLDDDR